MTELFYVSAYTLRSCQSENGVMSFFRIIQDIHMANKIPNSCFLKNGASDAKKEWNFGPCDHIDTFTASSRLTDKFVKIQNSRHNSKMADTLERCIWR